MKVLRLALVVALATLAGSVPALADSVRRQEAILIAEAYREFAWTATARHVRHGLDENGIEIHTPDSAAAQAPSGAWRVDQTNVGVPYKWGGFDTLAQVALGLRAGKAAGDIYSAEKRRRGGAAVSSHAAGIDCSGFISRCWKLGRKHSTSTLPSICKALGSTTELLPGDVMNQPGGHVMLFARWLDEAKTRALFYEAEPFSKVIASQADIEELKAAGMRPMRYREMRD